MARTRTNYPPEFKADVVQKASGGASVTAMAKEIGVRKNLIYQWIKAAKTVKPQALGKLMPAKAPKVAASSEVAALREEVETLRRLLTLAWTK